MTHLQQTCADMANTQDRLQRLYDVGMGFRRKPVDPALQRQLRHAIGTQVDYIAVCCKSLTRYPAANDEATAPEVA